MNNKDVIELCEHIRSLMQTIPVKHEMADRWLEILNINLDIAAVENNDKMYDILLDMKYDICEACAYTETRLMFYRIRRHLE